MANLDFLPATRDEMTARGWDRVDIVLVTGDAYIDHPSFGVALIGRWLESHSFRVAVLAQPHHDTPADFTTFGRPRLFFGITAGNMDSIVANYTANAKVRDVDDFSPAGNPYFGDTARKIARRRPDRATIRYANLARAAYNDVPIILGGLEASLRRFAHYDYQQQKIRGSILTDAKADLLVYGMGERPILEIADRLQTGRDLHDIPSTCERLTDKEFTAREFTAPPLVLPALATIQKNPTAFLTAELEIDKQARAAAPKDLAQKQQALWVLQHKPAAPLSTKELDALYDLPFARLTHPHAGSVPAYTMIRHSITIVRGCCGNCSFCAISRHQGPQITSRSIASITREVRQVTAMADFRGTISDLGGPTANLFGVSCSKPSCNRHDCLYPKICRHLKIDEKIFIKLLDSVGKTQGVHHLFISSGLRMELLLKTPELMARLIDAHMPGAMKIAPEHTEKNILRLMHKQPSKLLEQFLDTCRTIAAQKDKTIHFTPYFIASHPGCTTNDMQRLVKTVTKLGLHIRQFQDFTPTPGTLSTAMYVSGCDRDTGEAIPVARKTSERTVQRRLLEKIRPR